MQAFSTSLHAFNSVCAKNLFVLELRVLPLVSTVAVRQTVNICHINPALCSSVQAAFKSWTFIVTMNVQRTFNAGSQIAHEPLWTMSNNCSIKLLICILYVQDNIWKCRIRLLESFRDVCRFVGSTRFFSSSYQSGINEQSAINECFRPQYCLLEAIEESVYYELFLPYFQLLVTAGNTCNVVKQHLVFYRSEGVCNDNKTLGEGRYWGLHYHAEIEVIPGDGS